MWSSFWGKYIFMGGKSLKLIIAQICLVFLLWLKNTIKFTILNIFKFSGIKLRSHCCTTDLWNYFILPT